MSQGEGETSDRIPGESWLAIGAMLLGVFVIANDFTAMNVVLPDIEAELDADLSTVQWVVNGYALIFGILIVPGGRIADIYGRREALAVGAIIFAAFSLVGGLAPNVWVLIASRLLMGVGGALMWPAILGLMYALLPSSKSALAGALTIGVAGVGNASGPVLAGALGEIDWRLVFFLNVPIALIAMIAAVTLIKLPRERTKEHIDYVGTGLLSISLLSLLTTLTLAPHVGYTTFWSLAGFATFIVFMAAFVWWERRVGEAGLIPTSVARNRPFAWTCLCVLLVSAVFFAAVFYLPQFFQKVLGEDSLIAGVMLLPLVVVFAVMSFIEPSIVSVAGNKAIITIGAACLSLGAALIVLLVGDGASWPDFVPGMVVMGVGVGLFYSAITNVALELLPESQSSLAGGLLYMFQIAGGAVGLALATSVFLASSSLEIDDAANDLGVDLSTSELNDVQGVLVGTESSQQLLDQYPDQSSQLTEIVSDAFVTGTDWAFGFAAAVALAGFLVALFAVGGPPSQMFRDRPRNEAIAEDAAAEEAGAV